MSAVLPWIRQFVLVFLTTFSLLVIFVAYLGLPPIGLLHQGSVWSLANLKYWLLLAAAATLLTLLIVLADGVPAPVPDLDGTSLLIGFSLGVLFAVCGLRFLWHVRNRD